MKHSVYFQKKLLLFFLKNKFSWLCRGACGILVLWQGMELMPSGLKGGILTVGLPGKSPKPVNVGFTYIF